MAGVVIRRGRFDATWRRNDPEPIEELVDVLHLRGELLAFGLAGVVPMMAVVFEHRPAAGDVDDHGVQLAPVERGEIGVGELAGRFA